MRVAVLPTGRTEWHGLGRALGRLFPAHEFYCLPTAEVLLAIEERGNLDWPDGGGWLRDVEATAFD